MTNNEAWIEIDEIITFREIYGTDATVTGENKYEALRMAQEALEQQKPGNGNRISLELLFALNAVVRLRDSLHVWESICLLSARHAGQG